MSSRVRPRTWGWDTRGLASFVAVYDACVLYPAPLRDLLLRLAPTDLFRARWTENIHEEWMRSVLKDRPDLSVQ